MSKRIHARTRSCTTVIASWTGTRRRAPFGRYSRKTAASIGEVNLRKPEIADAIADAREVRSERAGVTADQVVAELDILRRSSVDDYEFDESGRLRVREGVAPEAIRAVLSVRHRGKLIPQKNGPRSSPRVRVSPLGQARRLPDARRAHRPVRGGECEAERGRCDH